LAKTYVHRCGRTARAGKEGHAISLLKGGQTRQFDKMRQLIHNTDQVDHNMSIKKHLVRDAILKYRHCVEALRDVLDAEENGELSHVEAINEDFFQT
jgi:ATP-dependent RNA helicase DDX51/DBP6